MKTLGVLIFPGFELLDVCGPLEVFGSLPEKFKIIIIAEKTGQVKSTQNIALVADTDFNSTPPLDLLLTPGGMGTRQEVHNQELTNWIKRQAVTTNLLLSVCTGSALLAKAGILDNRRATSNKKAFDWVMQQGSKVNWVHKARFVDDGNIITSSGIAAEIDMSLYVIAKLYGIQTSEKLARDLEYIWNKDANNDPFAKV
jgi:transcriptional regulator GlxA family with amidase domain